VAPQPRAVEARGLPELGVAGIQIDVRLAGDAGEDCLERQVTADVDEQVGPVCAIE
jgi:hypothetical protein